MGFKRFIIVWFSIMAIETVLMIGVSGTLNNRPGVAPTKSVLSEASKHFSVHWLGFIPDYSDQYPEYYACINDLLADTLYFPIALKLINQENSSFYFRVVQNQTPPAGWTLATNTLGLVNKDETRLFTYSALRTKPLSIPEGRLTETISLAVQAYYDSLYTQFYSEDSFAVTYNFLDRTSGAWTILDTDNFDDGAVHQWSSPEGSYVVVSTDLYRSFPYSLRCVNPGPYGRDTSFCKDFSVPSPFSEAYLIYAIRDRSFVDGCTYFNGTKCFVPDLPYGRDTWYQVAVPLPVNQTTQVRLNIYNGNPFLDNVYVIAK